MLVHNVFELRSEDVVVACARKDMTRSTNKKVTHSVNLRKTKRTKSATQVTTVAELQQPRQEVRRDDRLHLLEAILPAQFWGILKPRQCVSDYVIFSRSMSRRRKGRPGTITLQAKFKVPIRDCSSRKVTFLRRRKD
ncbi:hypothetical protein LSAT2_019337 [Lamellibrachia satsuma]|nr:hypothetical protein LSAT2_019337 [Lamellibrachia satsuma]